MSNNTPQTALEEKKKRDAQRFFFLWLKRFLVCYVLIIAAFFIYVFGVQGAKITFVGNIQKNYAKFLVEQNDVFVEYMVEFESLTTKTGAEYTEAEKAEIKACLEKQNEFLNTLQKRSPNEDNSDYLDLYQDMLQIFAFYIQGEIMVAEYCYAYTDNYTLENEYSDKAVGLEKYTLGKEMCNMMGNMVLNNFRYINEIRGTDYQSKYNIVEIGDSIGGSNSNNGESSTPSDNEAATDDADATESESETEGSEQETDGETSESESGTVEESAQEAGGQDSDAE